MTFPVLNVDENQAGTVSMGTCSLTGGTAAFTYSLVAGGGSTDNASFTLGANDCALSMTATADYEAKNKYSIRARVVDSNNLQLDTVFIIDINDLADPNDITLSSTSVDENSAGATVGTFTT